MQRPSSSGDRAPASGAGSAGSIPAWGTSAALHFGRPLIGLDLVPCIVPSPAKRLPSTLIPWCRPAVASAREEGSIPAWGTALRPPTEVGDADSPRESAGGHHPPPDLISSRLSPRSPPASSLALLRVPPPSRRGDRAEFAPRIRRGASPSARPHLQPSLPQKPPCLVAGAPPRPPPSRRGDRAEFANLQNTS